MKASWFLYFIYFFFYFQFLDTLDHDVVQTATKEGVVLVTGAGDLGQLGLGSDVLEKTRPALVKTDHEIVDVCAGGVHTVCLTKDGKVSYSGLNLRIVH